MAETVPATVERIEKELGNPIATKVAPPATNDEKAADAQPPTPPPAEMDLSQLSHAELADKMKMMQTLGEFARDDHDARESSNPGDV